MDSSKYIQKMMTTPLADVIKIADTQFQLLRRMESCIPGGGGFLKCITCRKLGHYKTFDSGHFIPRQHYGVRYDARNVNPQCKKCNKWLSGNHAIYRDALIRKLGKEIVEKMESEKDKTPALWKEKVIEVILKSRERIKELKKQGL